jgi:polysaccharide export outer membrane protein
MLRQFMKMVLAAFLTLAPVAAAAAQQSVPVAAPGGAAPLGARNATPMEAEAAYILGPGDIVEIEVLGQADFGKPRVRIRPDGTVPLPMIGSVRAVDLNLAQLATAVERRLIEMGFYRQPSANVEIVSYASRYVTVLGAVAQPGLVPIDRPYRVSEILARVGGVKETGADHVILSSANGLERKIPVQQLARGGVASDPLVSANDKLFVPAAEVFYIYGQVNAPGAYTVQEGMTLRQALARGGGLTASGSAKRLSVHRDGRKLKPDLNTVLRPGDVLVVGERIF